MVQSEGLYVYILAILCKSSRAFRSNQSVVMLDLDCLIQG